MAARGKTQAEIAQHFNRSERTIRVWLKEAQRRRLVAFRGMTPEQLLAASESKLLGLQEILLARLAAAEETTDYRGIAALIRELRGIEHDRYRFRSLAGFFAHVHWSHSSGDEGTDHGRRDAEILLEAIRDTFMPEDRKNRPLALPPPAAEDDDDAII
jgi:transposase-like protein